LNQTGDASCSRQEITQDSHQRGLAAPPRAGNGDRYWGLRLRIADEHQKAAGDRLELQRVHVVEPDGAICRCLVCDGTFAGRRTDELTGGPGGRHDEKRERDEHDPRRRSGRVTEAGPALSAIM